MAKKIKTYNFEIINTSYKSRIVTYRHNNKMSNIDLDSYLDEIQGEVLSLISEQREIHGALKVNLVIALNLKNLEECSEYVLRVKNVEIYELTSLEEYYANQKALLETRLQEHQGRGSNLNLDKILYIDVCINALNYFRGSSYVKLDQWIRSKKAVINVKNKDQMCF